MTNNTDSDYAYNVDDELDKHFHRLFEKRVDSDEEHVSKAKAKLGEIQEKRFFADFVEKRPLSPTEDADSTAEIFYGNRYEYEKDSLKYSDETKEYLIGKHFSIPVLPGMKIAVFQVDEDLVDYRTQTKYAAFKNLEFISEEEFERFTVYVEKVYSEGVSFVFVFVTIFQFNIANIPFTMDGELLEDVPAQAPKLYAMLISAGRLGTSVLAFGMVADVYSHIIDEDRRYNAQKFEEQFYNAKGLKNAEEGKTAPMPKFETSVELLDPMAEVQKESEVEEEKPAENSTDENAALLAKLLSNPETAALLKALAKTI